MERNVTERKLTLHASALKSGLQAILDLAKRDTRVIVERTSYLPPPRQGYQVTLRLFANDNPEYESQTPELIELEDRVKKYAEGNYNNEALASKPFFNELTKAMSSRPHTVRIVNSLEGNYITTVGMLCERTEEGIFRIRNLGKGSLNAIKNVFAERGLSFAVFAPDNFHFKYCED